MNQRHGRAGCRRALEAEERDHFLLLHQPPRFLHGEVWLVAVVGDMQFDAPAVDAARDVDFGEHRRDALMNALPQTRRQTALSVDHADADRLAGHCKRCRASPQPGQDKLEGQGTWNEHFESALKKAIHGTLAVEFGVAEGIGGPEGRVGSYLSEWSAGT